MPFQDRLKIEDEIYFYPSMIEGELKLKNTEINLCKNPSVAMKSHDFGTAVYWLAACSDRVDLKRVCKSTNSCSAYTV